jgi:hypothetical protein
MLDKVGVSTAYSLTTVSVRWWWENEKGLRASSAHGAPHSLSLLTIDDVAGVLESAHPERRVQRVRDAPTRGAVASTQARPPGG